MDNHFPYFEPEPELAPDLEWMIQSGQTPRQVLAGALLDTYYSPVYRLALAFLEDVPEAHRVIPDLFSAALENLYRFPQMGSLNAWLFRSVFQRLRKRLRFYRLRAAWQRWTGKRTLTDDPARSAVEAALWKAADELDWPERAILIFTHMLGLSLSESAKALDMDEERAQRALTWAKDYCAAAVVVAGGPDVYTEGQDGLGESLRQRWPEPDPLEEQPRAWLAGRIASLTELSTRGRRKVVVIKEVTVLVVVIGLVGSTLWASNLLFPGAEEQPENLLNPSGDATPGIQTTSIPKISEADNPLPTHDGWVFYATQPGGTWEMAAQALGTSPETLLGLNCIETATADSPIELDLLRLSPIRLGYFKLEIDPATGRIVRHFQSQPVSGQLAPERYILDAASYPQYKRAAHIELNPNSGDISVFVEGAQYSLLIEAYLSVVSGPHIFFFDRDEAGSYHNLRWVHLSQPQIIHSPKADLFVNEFAFSPDGSQVAMILGEPGEHISILDVRMGRLDHLVNLTEGSNLMWSPDGKYLAFTHQEDSSLQSAKFLSVFEVQIQARRYHEPVGIDNSIPADAPVQAWGFEYPPRDREAGACAP